MITDQSTEDASAEAFERTYRIWQKEHRLAFGMNGPQGSAQADALFLLWDQWLYKLNPTEDELLDATEWMAGQVEMHERRWESHWAYLRKYIEGVRETAAKIKAGEGAIPVQTPEFLEFVARGNSVTSRRIRKELVEKIGKEKTA